MLYVFAGCPKNGLHAGGLQHAIANVESLAILQCDPAIQYRKEGLYTPGQEGELLYPAEYQISDHCLRDAITWSQFHENQIFGDGISVHKTVASPEYRTVIYGTDLTLDRFLAFHGHMRLAREHKRHEGWEKYEARWLPGTCPKENRIVHLAWLVTI